MPNTEAATIRDQDQPKPLTDIAIGDRVWVSDRYSRGRGDLHTVIHLTPTQVHLDGYKNKFKRGTPSRWSKEPDWSGISFTRGRILSIATADEAAAWDAEVERKKADIEARKQEAANVQSKREELSELFGAKEGNFGIYVTGASFGDSEFRKNRYDVTFHSLTESEVRDMAKRFAAQETQK